MACYIREGKIRKSDVTYKFIGGASPCCAWGWNGGVGEIGSDVSIASVGTREDASSLNSEEEDGRKLHCYGCLDYGEFE